MLGQIFGTTVSKPETKMDPSQVYKVYLLDSNGKESKLFVFNGGAQTPFDAFSDIDKQIIRDSNIIPQYSSQQIHKDDSIRAIKKKIINEYGTNLVSYDELYMFSTVKKTFHLFTCRLTYKIHLVKILHPLENYYSFL